MNISDFLVELGQIVARRGAAYHLVDTLAFVDEVAERLEEDPVFGEFEQVEYQGSDSRRRTLRIHGFTHLEESDGTIGLVVGKWEDIDETQTLTTSAVSQLSGWVENFVRESIDNNLCERIEASSPAYELALLLDSQRNKINRIRLHIFTNLTLSSRFKEELQGEVSGIPIERHIWDIERLSALYQSSREREALEIDLKEYGSDGIPCIQAVSSDELTSYLCVIKGELRANLFDRYGSRLLEGNVRSFLGMRVGVNKKIRATVQDAPQLFFAYNNGIAATASEVVIDGDHGIPVIKSLVDFQIVNGGQTTASILSARKKEKLSLEGVSVQMKLTKVDQSLAEDMIPKIAEYANTQNRVAIADFFANHPFHRKMEEISRRLLTPAKVGQRVQSKWFYERARGQYQNERLYLSDSRKKSYDSEYPRSQLINKTDLAKYDNTWNEKPYWVSLGAQKNFTKFASQFDSKSEAVNESEIWERISPNYGDSFYKYKVAVAILWKSMEKIVDNAKNTWYQGGYRANIVTYTLAKLAHRARQDGGNINLDAIWNRQEIGAHLSEYLEYLAQKVQVDLIEPPEGINNIGEWCKKEACWNKVAAMVVEPVCTINGACISKEEFSSQKKEGKKEGVIDDGIEVQKKALDLTNSGYWRKLLSWKGFPEFFSPTDKALITKASTIRGFVKIGLEKDWRKLMKFKNIADEEGFRP